MDDDTTRGPGGDPSDRSKGKGHAPPPPADGGKVRPEGGTGTPETGRQVDPPRDGPDQRR